jgi:hypothetical protein
LPNPPQLLYPSFCRPPCSVAFNFHYLGTLRCRLGRAATIPSLTDSHGELLPDLPVGALAIMPSPIQAPLTMAQGAKRGIGGLALRVDAQGSQPIIDSIATNQSPDEEQTFGLGLRRSDLSLSGNGSVLTSENTRQVPEVKRNFGNYGAVSRPQQQGGLGEVSQTASETAKLVQAVTDKNAPTLQIQTSPSPDTAIPARVLSTFALSGTRLPPIAGGKQSLKILMR